MSPAPAPAAPTAAAGFVCRRCGRCCRWPGFVRLEPAEVTAAAAVLGLSEFEFIQRYTRLRPNRSGLALAEQPGGACIFLGGARGDVCRIQAVKPRQCRDFPLGWQAPGWRDSCRGVAGL